MSDQGQAYCGRLYHAETKQVLRGSLDLISLHLVTSRSFDLHDNFSCVLNSHLSTFIKIRRVAGEGSRLN